MPPPQVKRNPRPGGNTVTAKLRYNARDERAIAEAAARNARDWMQRQHWSSNSSGSIQPVSGEKGGYIGLRTTVDYVMYQNRGFEPFLMHWVEGRIVPIGGRSGNPHFVYGKDVGKPGWVTLPGGVRKWRDQKWRHPGLQGKRFLEEALAKAIKDHKPTLRQRLVDALMGRYGDGG